MSVEFEIEELSNENLAEAISCARICFPNSDDQEFLTEHWNRVLRGDVNYFCDSDQEYLTLLQHFVYRRQGRVCGFGGLYQHDTEPKKRWLNWFGVAPDARRSHVASRIILHLSKIACLDGATNLAGYTTEDPNNAATCRFYEALGFERVKQYSFRGETVRLYELAI